MTMSEELAALSKRAELACAIAQRLISENDHWRRRVRTQLYYMFELGAAFRNPEGHRGWLTCDQSHSEDS